MAETRGFTKDVEWYVPTIPPTLFSESMRKILREYSGIPDDQVEKHIYESRDRAWEIFPYPCVGRFSWLELSIGDAPEYAEVLKRVKAGERVLDIGCCFGQDLRKLVNDGAPSENLIGSDLEDGFFAAGYDLFKDRNTFQAAFIAADATAESTALDKLNGTIDIIHASSFFHLFSREKQVQVAVRCVKLLRHKPGALIFGRQAGNVTAGAHENRVIKQFEAMGGGVARDMWRHNVESWQDMWDEVGKLTGTKWEVKSYLYEDDSPGFRQQAEPQRRMRYSVRME